MRIFYVILHRGNTIAAKSRNIQKQKYEQKQSKNENQKTFLQKSGTLDADCRRCGAGWLWGSEFVQ